MPTDKPLLNKLIVIGITSSVAAIEIPKLVRELRRKGSEVKCVVTEDTKSIINNNVLQWASDNEVITKIDGKVPHVKLCGIGGMADLLLIAPSTANTIGKIASGVDDTPVTTCATTALGSGIPMIIAPAMHLSMYNHPIVKENIRKLEMIGVRFIHPKIEENKAKLMDISEIVNNVIFSLSEKDFKGKKVLVTAGPTSEYIDPVRKITNSSSGKFGIYFAEEVYQRGADVLLIKGKSEVDPKYPVKVINIETGQELYEAMKGNCKGKDFVIHAAAVSDFTLSKSKKKISSVKGVKLNLKPSKKIVEDIKNWNPKGKLVAFKAESEVSDEKLVDKAKQLQKKCKADLVIANDISKKGSEFGSETSTVYLVNKSKLIKINSKNKRIISNMILDHLTEI
ncbi:bifunctional phosphopantothenoylcysteine decarboxylase/phosphopantothenate--cysteine ligase CoaBC [Nanoarchaeota archaeon]